MLRSSRHPYQGTTLPQPQPQVHVRNPWIEKPESSTNSSCGSRGTRPLRNSAPVNASEWLLPRSQNMLNQGPLLNQEVHPVVVPSRGTASAAVSTVHGSSTAVSIAGGTDSCGGQCIACETFCYYCLQVLFIAGIFTGISLTVAGSVLRDNHRGDLMVLVYIGVLLTLVCILLLSVHCCVRRNVKERKRALRMGRVQGQRHIVQHPDFTSIPVQDYLPEGPCGDACMETNLNDFDYTQIQRPPVNLTVNPTYLAQMRSQSMSRHKHFPHDRRFYYSDLHDQQYPDWERRPYQSSLHSEKKMPNAGPVYQPTTVSYEQQGQWTSPTGLLAQSNGINRTRCLRWVTLAFGVLATAAGLIMVIEGSLDLSDTRQPDDIHPPKESNETDIVLIIIGSFLLLIGLVLIGLYIKFISYRKSCPCFLAKEQRMVHQLRDTQSINGQTMNPSTDLLVTAQYAPVSEIAYQPPAVSEEEETRKLMGSDNKDCSEDSERILDKDPRIVLRPLSKVEESHDTEAF